MAPTPTYPTDASPAQEEREAAAGEAPLPEGPASTPCVEVEADVVAGALSSVIRQGVGARIPKTRPRVSLTLRGTFCEFILCGCQEVSEISQALPSIPFVA